MRADPGRLEQVVLNLLVNAIEHAPGSATIEVADSTVGGEAKVVVRDHGRGVPPGDIRTMFDAYTRLGEARTGRPASVSACTWPARS